MTLISKKTCVSLVLCFVSILLFSSASFAIEFVEVPNKVSVIEKLAEAQKELIEQANENSETNQMALSDATIHESVYPQNIDTESILNLIPPKTATYTVIDVETGKSFDAVRYGGNKHLDTEPKTKDGVEIMKSFGESWDRRAVIVYYQGNFYAASMNTKPHGNGYVSSNGFKGHFCIHVKGSQTHGGKKVCELHQAMVKKAYETDLNTIPASAALLADETIQPVSAEDDANEEYSIFIVSNPQE